MQFDAKRRKIWDLKGVKSKIASDPDIVFDDYLRFAKKQNRIIVNILVHKLLINAPEKLKKELIVKVDKTGYTFKVRTRMLSSAG